MKLIITLALTSSISFGNAQTPLISHKSHAGTSGSYLIVSSSNFGVRRTDINKPIERPDPIMFEETKTRKVDNFKPLNDSIMILEVTDWNQNIIEIDTLPNKKRLSTNMFHYLYLDSIKKAKQLEGYRIEKQEQLEKHQLESEQQLNQEATPAKKKKKSYLLYLFGITGGGMLLTKLFGRSKNTNPSIA